MRCNYSKPEKRTHALMTGNLYLIPNTLGDVPVVDVIPQTIGNLLNEIDVFIVEDARTARRFLKKAGYTHSLDTVVLHLLNEHTPVEQTKKYLDAALNGKNVGILSEAGNPCIADPGAIIVKLAHQKNIRVIPIVGPSSILLALIASGFNGQCFCFHGYLPKEKTERFKKIKSLEREAIQKNQTQLFIETPYRNNQLLQELIAGCDNSTKLCIACDLTLTTEFIKTKSISDWKKEIPELNKRPALFLIGA